MPIIEWNVTLLLGVSKIDQYHQHLVQLLNNAYDEFRDGVHVPTSVVEEIVCSTAEHFSYEEELMAEISYPKLEQHKSEHELFSCRIIELQRKHKQNGHSSIELLWFLCNWVTHHIRETDAELGRFLDVRNIRKRL